MGTASIWKGDDQIPVCQYSKDKMFVTFEIGKLLQLPSIYHIPYTFP